MNRPELPVDALIVGYIDECGKATAWDSVIRLKWILNSATTLQQDDDEMVKRATKETFSNL